LYRFKIGFIAVIESVVFLTGSFILISILGFLLAIILKNSFVPYFLLSCWSIVGLLVLAALAKALWEGKRFIEIFDRFDDKEENSGVARVYSGM
jgi:hypothetical protein